MPFAGLAMESLTSTDLENCYSTETVELLSKGLIKPFKLPLNKIKQELHELTNKQTILIEQLHNENLQISQSLHSAELHDMFTLVREYHLKLLNIKKDMRFLHERTNKLKKRALKLQEYKDKEVQKRNDQLIQEQDLIGKPTTSVT